MMMPNITYRDMGVLSTPHAPSAVIAFMKHLVVKASMMPNSIMVRSTSTAMVAALQRGARVRVRLGLQVSSDE